MTGVVSLSAAAATRVLAYYLGSGSPTDPVTLSTIEAVTISGTYPCDLLYDPPPSTHPNATLSHKLQLLNRYATTATATTAEVFVRNPSSGARDTNFQATIGDGGYVEVSPLGISLSGSMTPPQRDEYRRPFESTAADMSWIYTTDFAST